MTLCFEKVKNMVISVYTLLWNMQIICTHRKCWALQSQQHSTCQYYTYSKIFINENLCKARTDHSKSKSDISKKFSIFLPKPWTAQSATWQRQLCGSSQKLPQNGPNKVKIRVRLRSFKGPKIPQGPSRQREQIGTFARGQKSLRRAQNGSK